MKITKETFRLFQDKFNFTELCVTINVPESFIKENIGRFDWGTILPYPKFSESFIREFANKVSWTKICSSQNLSEDFIREFSDKVDWYIVCFYQKL